MAQPVFHHAIETYEALEESVLAFVDEAFFKGPFFTNLSAGSYSRTQLSHFASQYSHYSRHFPRVLGAAIAAMPGEDTWWVPLADNLWDEAGRGMPMASHQRLYLTFLHSVNQGAQAGKREDGDMSVYVSTAIETFIDFFRNCTPLEAMAAVGLGSEIFAGQVMGFIGKALKHPHYQSEGELDVRFWDLHADEHEPRHYQLCKDILLQHASLQNLASMHQVATFIAESEAKMYTGLHEEMTRLGSV